MTHLTPADWWASLTTADRLRVAADVGMTPTYLGHKMSEPSTLRIAVAMRIIKAAEERGVTFTLENFK